MKNNESNKGEIVMYQPDETIRLEVRMGEETVWLTQQQMAELFDKDRTVIGRHIRNIYKEEELEKSITCAKYAHMGTDGDQEYEYTAYNLDVIISVGYRVKSKRGTKFRQWANGILKEYLLREYVVNARIMALEQHVAEQDIQIIDLKNKVDFFVHSSLPPVEGIFYDGQILMLMFRLLGLSNRLSTLLFSSITISMRLHSLCSASVMSTSQLPSIQASRRKICDNCSSTSNVITSSTLLSQSIIASAIMTAFS